MLSKTRSYYSTSLCTPGRILRWPYCEWGGCPIAANGTYRGHLQLQVWPKSNQTMGFHMLTAPEEVVIQQAAPLGLQRQSVTIIRVLLASWYTTPTTLTHLGPQTTPNHLSFWWAATHTAPWLPHNYLLLWILTRPLALLPLPRTMHTSAIWQKPLPPNKEIY